MIFNINFEIQLKFLYRFGKTTFVGSAGTYADFWIVFQISI